MARGVGGTQKRGPKGPSKWTDEVVERIADELVAWFKSSPANWYLMQFAIEYDYLACYFDDWAHRNEKFNVALKKAKQIQEARLVQLALARKVDTTMAIFALKNVAGWRDKQEHEHTGNSTNIIIIRQSGEKVGSGNQSQAVSRVLPV